MSTSAKARKSQRREQAREEILDAAQTVLLERGLGAMTLAEVARRVQLTKPALYYYFESKESLVHELVFRGLQRHAEHVGRAIEQTDSGEAALEALIRSSAAHYRQRLDEFRLGYLSPQLGTGGQRLASAEHLERIRPFNEQIYGAVARKIEADQQAGKLSKALPARRLAFLAHAAVLGVLTFEGAVESTDNAPLIHSPEQLIDELVLNYRARLRAG